MYSFAPSVPHEFQERELIMSLATWGGNPRPGNLWIVSATGLCAESANDVGNYKTGA